MINLAKFINSYIKKEFLKKEVFKFKHNKTHKNSGHDIGFTKYIILLN